MDRPDDSPVRKRPFVGIHFRCCKVYARIYLNNSGTAFVGWCPKCARKAEVKVSESGSSTPFFTTD